MSVENTLILGGNSQLGKALAHFLEQRSRPFTVTHHRIEQQDSLHFDLLDASTWSSLPRASRAVLCCGITGIQACEDDPDGTYRINVEATQNALAFFAERETRVLILSSSAVFDGCEPQYADEARPSPQNVYGQQKAEIEAVIKDQAFHAGLRLSKVLSPDFSLFHSWCSAMKKGSAINAFYDVAISPVTTAHAAEAMLAVLEGSDVMTNFGASDAMSYAEVARSLATYLDLDPDLVRPVSAVDLGITVTAHAQLHSVSLAHQGFPIPSAQETLGRWAREADL